MTDSPAMKIEICEYCGKPGDYPYCVSNKRRPRHKNLSQLVNIQEAEIAALKAIIEKHQQPSVPVSMLKFALPSQHLREVLAELIHKAERGG